MARILIADVQEGIDRLTRVLVQKHDLLIARDVTNAYDMAQHLSVDLIICGLQFDESRMFEFLKTVKKNEATKNIPFVCFRQAATSLSKGVEHGMDVATRYMGALSYIDASTTSGMSDDDLLRLVEDSLNQASQPGAKPRNPKG